MKRIALFLTLSLVFVACKDKISDTEEKYQYVNEWIYDNMSLLYYWNTSLPKYTSTTLNPSMYFPTLKNKDDRFSALFEDYQYISKLLNGVSSAEVGFDFQLYRESAANDNVVAIVLYVKPGTAAASLGIKRGDMFRQINGTQITVSNYSTLLNYFSDSNATVSINFTQYLGGEFYDKVAVVVTKSVDYKENPVYLDTVYTVQDKKIGYLVYNFFSNDSGDGSMQYDLKLNTAIANFKAQNISELVVDLRYNSGGMMTSAINFASMLVPNLTENKVFAYTDYNQNYTEYFNSDEFKKQTSENPFIDNFATYITAYSPKTQSYAVQNVGNNLQRIFFITGQHTASASEMVINGLKPFLPCVLIGDTTVGKNVGSTLVHDTDNADNQWAFMPIILKYFNKDHQSDFTQGFAPDFRLDDDYSHALGDTNETLLAKAISEISGSNKVPNKISRMKFVNFNSRINFESMPHGLIVKNKGLDLYFKQK